MGRTLLLAVILLILFQTCNCYQWKTFFYKQQVSCGIYSSFYLLVTSLFHFHFKVDHFSFISQEIYPQRYLINTTYWKRNGGPIFFYAGNEGDIELFAQNTVKILCNSLNSLKLKNFLNLLI